MEDILNQLINTNSAGNRENAAFEWKKRGKKVIGVLGSHVPEEVVYACGMLPWRIIGSWGADVSLAQAYRPVNVDVYYTHVLQSILAGDLDFLDGIVFTYHDDDARRVWDVCMHLNKWRFAHMLYLPHKDGDLAQREFAKGIGKLVEALEKIGDVHVTQDSLRNAIDKYNEWRKAMMRLYELRKRQVPPVSGGEVLAITTASFFMPKDEFSQKLNSVLDYLEKRRTLLSRVRPRLLVSSENLDNPAYLHFIESLGCLVAMDDLDTGSRYFWKEVDADEDPLGSLSKRYLTCPPCPRQFNWDTYIDQLIEWVREFDIDGVLNLPNMYDQWRQVLTPHFEERLTMEGIPVKTFVREYAVTNLGQLGTRIGTFLEMLEGAGNASD